MGRARVIEISNPVSIEPDELEAHDIGPGQRALFKTANSLSRWWERPFSEDYVFLSLAGARFLAERGVACVGNDYLSIAGMGPQAAQTHVALLQAGVWIIEGLYLGGIEPGDYELACLPLPLQDADGAPVRVALRPL
jgi:arylformamidase